MANSDNCLRSFLCPELGNDVKAMMKTKTKTKTYRYELAMSFSTLQQHVAQHMLQYTPNSQHLSTSRF